MIGHMKLGYFALYFAWAALTRIECSSETSPEALIAWRRLEAMG
jgi:hypothetical protein